MFATPVTSPAVLDPRDGGINVQHDMVRRRAGALHRLRPVTATLKYSQPAPEFTLPATGGRSISLADFRGRADVVLVFYCYDFGGI
jgi:AhpC/TSA family